MKLFSKKSLSLLCAIGVLGFCACSGNNEVRETLQRAESLMEDRPDSSLQIIKDIDALSLKSRKDIALYSLLRTQAEDKNYIDTTDTRIITRAVDYYSTSKDEYHKMLSYYYAGRVEENAGEYTKAIVNQIMAEKSALKLEDDFYLGLIYCSFSNIYDEVYSNVESLKYARKSYESFVRSGREKYINWALVDLWRSYNNGGNYEAAAEVAGNIVKVAEASCDTLLLSNGLRYAGISNLGAGKYNESIAAYTRLKKAFPDYLELSDLRNLGIAYVGTDQIDSTIFYMDYVSSRDSSESWLPYEVSKAIGDIPAALQALEKSHRYQSDVLKKVLEENITATVLNFRELDERQQEERLKYEKNSKLLYVTILIMFCLLLLVVIFYQIKLYRRKIEDMLSFAAEQQYLLDNSRIQNANLQSFVHETKVENENLQFAINELYGQSFKAIDELCGDYYTKDGKFRVVKRVERMIKELRNDEKTISELEAFVNKYKNNVMFRFRQEYPDMRDADYKLFLYLSAGLSVRTISVLLDIESEAMSSRKKRLKRKISESESQFREEFIKAIG